MIAGLAVPDANLIITNGLVAPDTPTLPLPQAKKCTSSPLPFDVVCITAHLPSQAEAFAMELQHYTQFVFHHVIPVADLGGQRMGSGGATLDALVEVVEHLSSLAGDPYHNEQRLKGKRILILHTGGSTTYNPASWIPSPQCSSDGRPQTAIENLLEMMNAIGSTPAQDDCELWVCSSEMLTTSGLGSDASR